MSKCSLPWLLRYLSIAILGGIFSLVYLMFVVCKAISLYIKKTSYNWEFIAEKSSSLLGSWSSSRCACITCTYASYRRRECAPFIQLTTICFFPTIFHRAHLSYLSMCCTSKAEISALLPPLPSHGRPQNATPRKEGGKAIQRTHRNHIVRDSLNSFSASTKCSYRRTDCRADPSSLEGEPWSSELVADVGVP